MASSPNGPDLDPAAPPGPPPPVRVSVVVPVYRGEFTLERLIAEIVPLAGPSVTPAGTRFVVCEIVLVHDGAVDGSARVLMALAAKHPIVLPLWLSRNFGQHAATLAGMASTTGDWVVTLDEDGQHNPSEIGVLLDAAISSGSNLVYGRPLNPPPHGWLRNAFSRTAKRLVALLVGNNRIALFQSYRLLDGEIARSLAAYCGQGVYLDIALGWVVDKVTTAPVTLRREGDRKSGYNYLKLFSHFWRLVLTAGTRPLRMIALLGGFSILVAIGVTIKAFIEKWLHQVPVAGWTSLIVVLSFFSGVILFSLSVIAEYMGLTLNMAMGRPAYLVVGQPPRQPPRNP